MGDNTNSNSQQSESVNNILGEGIKRQRNLSQRYSQALSFRGSPLSVLKESDDTSSGCYIWSVREMRCASYGNLDEENLPVPEGIELKDFNKMDNKTKFSSLMTAINGLCKKLEQVDCTLYHDSDGLMSNCALMQDQLDETTTGVNILENNQHIIRSDVDTLKGIVQKHSDKLKNLNEEVVYLTAKSMEKNVTISGIKESKDENCKMVIATFLRNTMNIELQNSEILVAHRVGPKRRNKHRFIVVRCHPELKQRILSNAKNLKGNTNEDGASYYVNKQLPDQYIQKE